MMRQSKVPYLARVTALIATIAEYERAATIYGLIELIGRMTVNYGLDSRIKFAERLRDLADSIEHSDDEARWMTENAK